MSKRYLSTIFFLILGCLVLTAQNGTLTGIVMDEASNEPLIGATVQVKDAGTITDFDGSFSLSLAAGNYQLTVSYVGFTPLTRKISVTAGQTLAMDFYLTEEATILNTVTVTSGKFEKPLSEVTVSLDVLQPGLIESTSKKSIDEALNKIPGVNIIDGQANIRGGSGYSYGAGSRVLLLMDDMPILQPDAGFPFWDDIPIENIEQVEVVKGAASALYGSSALNGIINIRTAYAKSKPVTKIGTFYTTYFKPEQSEKAWWDQSPGSWATTVSHKRKIDKLDLVVGGYYIDDESYNKDTYKKYGRFNFNTRYRITDRLSAGLNGNFNQGKSGSFFYWKGADNPYEGAPTTIGTNERLRYNLDPFVTYYDKAGNRHKFLGRFFHIDNENLSPSAQDTINQSNRSDNYYAEYQFQRQFEDIDLVATAGLVAQGGYVSAELYGDTTFTARNLAAFLQLDKKFFDKLNVSAGFRYENNFLDNPGFRYGRNNRNEVAPSQDRESKPVFRFGLNYQAAKYTYIRASIGQGYRYPSIAEKYIFTQAGGVIVVPNPPLTSETGWSGEIAVKQGFKISSFEGFFDAAAFISRYQDMIEFNLVPGGFNFQAVNIGGTDIQGVEFSIIGRGKFFGLPTSVLTGYTYINPRYELFDPDADRNSQAFINFNNSSANRKEDNILKYRPRHTFKGDIETEIKNFRIGWEGIYQSKTETVDAAFLLIIPGFGQYFVDENRGFMINNFRLSYNFKDFIRVSTILNNTFNREYFIRPGLLGAPRHLTLRLDFTL
jgi:iron complex outermembrane receptor protein